jgi:hypothetical protein
MENSEMTSQWGWLLGRKFSLGKVVDVLDDTATVAHGDGQVRVLICELLEEDYKARDRYEGYLSEVWNTGDGVYRP